MKKSLLSNKKNLFRKIKFFLERTGYERIVFRRVEELYFLFFRSREVRFLFRGKGRVNFRVCCLRKVGSCRKFFFSLIDPLLLGSDSLILFDIYLKRSKKGIPLYLVFLLQSGPMYFCFSKRRKQYISKGIDFCITYSRVLFFLVQQIKKVRSSLTFGSLRFFLSKLLYFFLFENVKGKIKKLVSILSSKDNYSVLKYFIFLFYRLGFLDFSFSKSFFVKKEKKFFFHGVIGRFLQQPCFEYRKDPLIFSETPFKKSGSVYLRHFQFPFLDKIGGFGFFIPSSFFFF